LSLLSLGARTSSTRGFEVITRYPSLNRLFAGINFLNDPILSSITYEVQFYQQFWAMLVDELHRLVITTLSKLNYVAFWKAPEELFVIMGKYGLRFETLQFGRLNQSLTRLCCFDSVIHFDDLDWYLPPTLSCISISIFLARTSTSNGSKCVDSLLNFIERLANVNAYPHLEEMHLQVQPPYIMGREIISQCEFGRCLRLVMSLSIPELMRLLLNEYGGRTIST
uniref:NR LBD domain-containing protein n=1 Tax=Angiostrongylus cantonensis TaxID=6313 RepID=A0A0K0D9R4_ANGCA